MYITVEGLVQPGWDVQACNYDPYLAWAGLHCYCNTQLAILHNALIYSRAQLISIHVDWLHAHRVSTASRQNVGHLSFSDIAMHWLADLLQDFFQWIPYV